MNIKKLLTRTMSGIIYCGIIVGCVLLGEYGILGLACLLAILSCIEFARIDNDLSARTIPTLLLDIAGCLSLCFGFLGYTLIIWLAIIIARLILELYITGDNPIKSLSHSFLSQIYIGLPMGLMAGIGYLFDPMIVLAIFIIIWINDTGAFLVGSLVGKHKLFERVSPKKTWEGFIGGFLICILSGVIFSKYCNEFFGMTSLNADMKTWIIMSSIISIFGTWGDLVESMIKRSLHIKDSGNLIPGHGGILDRIDSLLLVLPSIFIYFMIIFYNNVV